jgi:hypothetical protein
VTGKKRRLPQSVHSNSEAPPHTIVSQATWKYQSNQKYEEMSGKTDQRTWRPYCSSPMHPYSTDKKIYTCGNKSTFYCASSSTDNGDHQSTKIVAVCRPKNEGTMISCMEKHIQRFESRFLQGNPKSENKGQL